MTRLTPGSPRAVNYNGLTPIEESLNQLCDRSLAVQIYLRSGEIIDGVLIGCSRTHIIFETWSVGSNEPSGDISTLDISGITEIRVY